MPTTMPTVGELDSNIYFAHHTTILPAGGLMSPGKVYKSNEIEGSIATHMLYLQHVPNTRMTIHWCVNGIVISHEGWSASKLHRYVIIELAKRLRPYLYGGYAEDFWSVGHYLLSCDAIVIVPINELENAKKILYPFEGEIITYSDQLLLEKTVLEQIEKRSSWKITIPPNQKKEMTLNILQDWERIAAITALPVYKNIRIQVQQALQEGKESISIKVNCVPKEIILYWNNQPYKAIDFFDAWYTEGKMYEGGHEGSLFGSFEDVARSLITPLIILYENPDIKDLTQYQLSIGQPLVPSVQEMNATLQKTRKLLDDIEVEFKKNPYLSLQLNYYLIDEWKINFNIWLSLFDEDLHLRSLDKKGLFADCYILNKKIAEIVKRTTYVIGQYQDDVIEDQSMAKFLSKRCAIKFLAFYQKNKSYYVDAISDELSEEKLKQVGKHLYSQRIPYFFFKNRIVVPRVNMQEVNMNIQTMPEMKITSFLKGII